MGFLSKKLTNVKYHAKRKLNESSIIESESINRTGNHDDVDADSENQKIDVENLKSKFVATDVCGIKEKLKSTLSYRSKMLEKKDLDLKENFPYFFTNPELVNSSFEASKYFLHRFHIAF